jgi:hypothetical protein
MYRVYIVLTRTNTLISKAIRIGTGYNYNHVSLSLEDNLSELYSFGRRTRYNPFNGGFVVENFNKGVLAEGQIRCKVYKIDITKKQYMSLKKELSKFKSLRDQYQYNYLGAILLKFNRSRTHDNKYFCSQFVAYILHTNRLLKFIKNPEMYLPADFERHNELELVYEGNADRYRVLQSMM